MVCYKMDKWLMCVVALILGMLMFHMLKNVCGCKVVEGQGAAAPYYENLEPQQRSRIASLIPSPVAPPPPPYQHGPAAGARWLKYQFEDLIHD